MASRLDLQKKLEDLLESDNVYYQPPESLKIEYPAIIYSISKLEKRIANNGTYILNANYSLTVIDRRPDNPIIKKLLDLPYCSYDRHYISNNLYHDVFNIYY